MAFPTLITVNGILLKADGTPERGRVYFYVNERVLSGTDETVIVPSYERAILDEDGAFSLTIPASNDPDWTPEGWEYTVVVQVTSGKYSFDTVVPFDAPGLEIDFSELLPALEGGSALYAAYNHTHASAPVAWNDITGKPTAFTPTAHTHLQAQITDLDFPVDSVAGKTGAVTLVKGDVGLGLVDNTTDLGKPVSTATQTALNLLLPKANGEVVDSTFSVRKGDNSSGIRIRSTGGAVDFDKMNGDIVISSFAGPGYAGTQTGLQRWRGNGSTFAGYTEFGDTVYGGAQYVDGANALSFFNAAPKNGLQALNPRGRKTTTGAPTTGTWVAGDAILDSAKVWWYCTVGGTPGTWV